MERRQMCEYHSALAGREKEGEGEGDRAMESEKRGVVFLDF